MNGLLLPVQQWQVQRHVISPVTGVQCWQWLALLHVLLEYPFHGNTGFTLVVPVKVAKCLQYLQKQRTEWWLHLK